MKSGCVAAIKSNKKRGSDKQQPFVDENDFCLSPTPLITCNKGNTVATSFPQVIC